jgi:hypothetical protein
MIAAGGGGSGDMTKAVYDTNDDGEVDLLEDFSFTGGELHFIITSDSLFIAIDLTTGDTLFSYTEFARRETLASEFDAKKNLTDVDLFFAYGAGAELAGDTALFLTTLDKVHGDRRVYEDSVEFVYIEYELSAGDTLDCSLEYGSTLWSSDGTIADFNLGGGTGNITSFTTSTIPDGNHVWVDVTYVEAGKKPTFFRMKVYTYIKRD